MFRVVKLMFRVVELIYRVAELMYHDVKHNFFLGLSTNSLRSVNNFP